MSAPVLNKQLPVPLYHQVKAAVLQRIRTGDLKPNDQLPAEDLLARQFAVSKATVRHALNDLTSEGLLRRVQGSGTFVADSRLELGSQQFLSFTAEMRARGLQPSSFLVGQEVQIPDARVAEALQLGSDSRVLCLRRVRLADGQPMMLQTAYVPLQFAPSLDRHDFGQCSLYEILSNVYHLIPARAHETHRAVLLSAAEAGMLDCEAGTAALKVRRITFDVAGRRFELADSLMRGDRHEIVFEVTGGTHKFLRSEF